MIKRLLARYVIRLTWKMCLRVQGRKGYGEIGQMFNTLALIPTALGGNSGWFPKDVTESFRDILRERGLFKSVS